MIFAPTVRQRLLEVGGFAAWLGPGTQNLFELWLEPALRADPSRQACTAAFFLFGLVYAATCFLPLGHRWKVALLTVQTGVALWLSWYPYGAFSAVFAVTTAEAAFLLPGRAASAWLLAQVAGTTALFLLRPDMSLVTALTATAMYATFELFTLFAARSIVQEVFARSELARINVELLQARATLAEHARAQERLKISRELHDSVGHHLTALALKLEVACHSPPEASAVQVREARAMVGEVLVEMRAVVTEMRDQDHPPLGPQLRALAGHISSPRVHLALPEPLEVEDHQISHVLYRCTQEIITNAARHAQAQNLWIRLQPEGEHVLLEAKDDGRGTAKLSPNSGLRVMRERVEEVGGELHLNSQPSAGLSVRIRVPLRSR